MSEDITNTSIMLEESANDIDSFYFTKVGIIIAMVTGSISFLSSMIIISIVLRSMSGIKTTYHRIILGLSSADCLTSLAIALATIPMPKDVIYPFEMPSYGNITTCEAQGLVYMMGNAFAFCMNGILNIYYLCTLRYNMPEKTFRCYLEIPLFIAAFVLCVTVPSATLIKEELLNPSPTDPFCVPNTYPLDCTKADNPECRGGGGRGGFNPIYLFTISLSFFTVIITMALVVHAFYRNERRLRRTMKDSERQEGDETHQDLQYAHKLSKIITKQALMYIVAFLITWIFGFVQFVIKKTENETEKGFVTISRMIFQPLQGFFNLIIFVYHKVCIVLESDEDLTINEALAIVFLHPDDMEDSVLVCNLDLVFGDYYGNGRCAPRESAVVEIDISSEDGDLDVSHSMHFDSVIASRAHSKGEASAGKKTNVVYKYYGVQKVEIDISRALQNRREMKVSLPSKEVKNGTDGDLSEISRETNDDGISYASRCIKKSTEDL